MIRKNIKVHNKKVIYDGREEAGFINLVSYTTKVFPLPHLEFYLKPEFRKRGIMSKELPKYLKYLKKYENYQMVALVDKDNEGSIKLLERNNFVRLLTIKERWGYIIDLRFTKDILENALNKFEAAYSNQKIGIFNDEQNQLNTCNLTHNKGV